MGNWSLFMLFTASLQKWALTAGKIEIEPDTLLGNAPGWDLYPQLPSFDTRHQEICPRSVY